ncbi:MAG TPA: hypothetical protein VFZ57_08045 [Thermoanaerobaculia bacterium]|nr:hypothetical protein [Thermoanaerobaculia bacterium]
MEAPLRPALRGFFGFAAGLAFWWGATPAYNRALAEFAEGAIRAFERPRATRLYAEDRRIVIDRADFPSTSGRPSLPADDLTFDVILFFALAATVPGLARDRALRGVVVSLLVLFLLHVLAVVANVESLYATHLGEWSAARYGAFVRNLWATAAHFWRFVGCYAAAFLLWWFLVRSPASALADASGSRRFSRRRKGKVRG